MPLFFGYIITVIISKEPRRLHLRAARGLAVGIPVQALGGRLALVQVLIPLVQGGHQGVQLFLRLLLDHGGDGQVVGLHGGLAIG